MKQAIARSLRRIADRLDPLKVKFKDGGMESDHPLEQVDIYLHSQFLKARDTGEMPAFRS